MTSRMRAREVLTRILTLLLLVPVVAPATAQETTTYTYDARGRLVTVNHGISGPNANIVSGYAYDGADNRCQQIVRTDGTTPTPTCPNVVNITLSPTALPGGTVSTSYSQTITASGGTSPYTYSKTAGTLPAGLTLNSSTGVLSGTPTTATTYNFTITATDSASHTGSQAYAVTIGAGGTTCSGVSFSVGIASANEGSPLSFTVTKSGTTSDSCSVSYATADNTAKAGTNYTAKSGSLNFSSSSTSANVSVSTLDDGVVTGDLTMYLNLSNPSGSATISTGQGTGTIHNIDTSGVQPPTPVNDTGTQSTCSTNDYDVVANDTDPGGNYPLSLVSVAGSGGFSVVSSTDVEFTSTLSTGSKVATYTVQNSKGVQATATLTVTVTSGGICNAPPPAPGG